MTLIDQSPDVVEKAREWAPKVNVMLGDACEPWVLEGAELSKAEVVVAATGDDEDNLVTSLLAKQEFAVPRVLARVNHPKNEWLFTEQWGVDAAVSPPHILTAMVEEAVTVGDLVRLIRLEGGRISIVEMTLPDSSPSVGRPLYELRLPPDSAVVAVLRDGHVVIPQPETVFSPGDEVVALSSPTSESSLRNAIVGDGMAGDHATDRRPDRRRRLVLSGALQTDHLEASLPPSPPATSGRAPASGPTGRRTPAGCDAPVAGSASLHLEAPRRPGSDHRRSVPDVPPRVPRP